MHSDWVVCANTPFTRAISKRVRVRQRIDSNWEMNNCYGWSSILSTTINCDTSSLYHTNKHNDLKNVLVLVRIARDGWTAKIYYNRNRKSIVVYTMQRRPDRHVHVSDMWASHMCMHDNRMQISYCIHRILVIATTLPQFLNILYSYSMFVRLSGSLIYFMCVCVWNTLVCAGIE